MTDIPAGIAIHCRDLATDWSEAWWSPLSSAERDRAARYAREDDRRRFVAGRHLMRTMLAPIAGCPAAAVAITIDRHGRPGVAGVPSFSLTHAGCHVALAIAPATPALAVGIDIERVRDDIDPLTLGRQVLADPELAAVRTARDRIALFFRLWTVKEAVLKAAGMGLLVDPRTLCIDALADPPTIVRAPPQLASYACAVLPSAPHHAAALAWRAAA